MTAIASLPVDETEPRTHRPYILGGGVVLAVAVVLVVYVWIASAGTWTRWPTYGNYYQDLADGFRKGQTSLATKPNPKLLALKDPFDPALNEGLRIHDVSLYKGRFYLYWGPVPALLLTASNLVGVPKLDDQYLAFAFAAGSLLFAAKLIVHLWRRFFHDTVPTWAVPLAVLTTGLANPGPFNLGRASIYEAAILSAQMFLIGGLYFVVTAIRDGRASTGRLLLAGTLLACAVGSRASVALPVAGIALIAAWHVVRLPRRGRVVTTRDQASLRRVAPPPADPGAASRTSENVGFAFVMPRGAGGWDGSARQPRAVPLAALLGPLFAAALALAAYNYVRFGSVAELGVRYQLAGFNSTAANQPLTSVRNVAPNLYSYLLRAPLAKPVFPYLVPRSGLDAAFPRWVPVPRFHVRDDTVAGMLLATPFAVFAAVALVRRRRREDDDVAVGDPAGGLSAQGVAVTLAVVVPLAAVPALVLSFSTMRYLADWTMPLILLATLGFWTGCAARPERAGARRAWLSAGAVLMSITVLVGPLLGVTGALDQFARHNPALMKRMIEATYAGPVPGVAQVSGPAGVDLTDDGRGWWLGDRLAAVDVMATADGRYSIEFTAAPAAGAFDGKRVSLLLGENPDQPLARTPSTFGTAELHGPPAATQQVRFSVPLKRGLNRLFLSIAEAPLPSARRLVAISHVSIRAEAGMNPAASIPPQ